MTNKESKSLTREYIKTALLQLMKKQPFEKITVTAIIQRSGVSRAGFYRNYSCKEEVLEEIIQYFYEQITDYFLNELKPKESFERYKTLFEDLKKQSNFISSSIEAKKQHHYEFNSTAYIEQLCAKYSRKEQYYALALWYGIREIVHRWIENGMKESPEEMATIINNLYNFDIIDYKE